MQSRLCRPSCTGRHPVRTWTFPEETPELLWADCSSAPSPLLWRSYYTHLCRMSCASFCGHFPLSYCHALLKRVWPHPFASYTLDIYRHWSDPLWVFFSQVRTDPGCSAFPRKRGAHMKKENFVKQAWQWPTAIPSLLADHYGVVLIICNELPEQELQFLLRVLHSLEGFGSHNGLFIFSRTLILAKYK